MATMTTNYDKSGWFAKAKVEIAAEVDVLMSYSMESLNAQLANFISSMHRWSAD